MRHEKAPKKGAFFYEHFLAALQSIMHLPNLAVQLIRVSFAVACCAPQVCEQFFKTVELHCGNACAGALKATAHKTNPRQSDVIETFRILISFYYVDILK